MKKSLGAKALVFPTPVWVICVYDSEGRPNAMTAAWGGICCSNPPAVGISLRKATYTYDHLSARKAFTVNVPGEAFAAKADYFGIVSGRNHDKFKETGLTPVKADLVDAPYISEFPLILECRLIQTVEIGLHTQFIGQVMDVKAEEGTLDENGLPDMQKVGPMIYAPEVRAYFKVGEPLGRAFNIGKK